MKTLERRSLFDFSVGFIIKKSLARQGELKYFKNNMKIEDMVFEDVRSVKDCIKLATLDTYSQHEEINGWCHCLNDIFPDKQEVKLLGEWIYLHGFDTTTEDSLVAVLKKGKYKALVTVSSLEFPKANKIQKLWIKSYLKHQSGF